MSENKSIVKATGVIGLATLASRILGFIRDMVVAGIFGAGMITDAFFIAFRIPSLLRRLFAEGSLSASFIPVFTECLEKKSKEDAWALANAVIGTLSVVLMVVTVLGIIFAPLVVKILAPGFPIEKFELTVFLTRIIFPYIFFIALAALAMGILNSLKHFVVPALSPVLLNVSMICAALFLSPLLEKPIVGLAVGVVVGGILQLAIQIYPLKKRGMIFKADFGFNHPGVKKIAFLMFPGIFGLAVTQINTLVDTILASLLPEGSVSYLYYGDRLVQFPLGVFGIALATATLPFLASQAARKDYRQLKETISFTLRLLLFITIPAMVGLIVLRIPIITLLFQRGEFTSEATVYTAQALLYYAVGLWAYAGVKMIVQVFYSLQDTKTPVKVAVIAMIVNIILNLILMVPLKHGGLALATALSAMLNFTVLLVILRKRLGKLGGRRILNASLRIFFASFVMGLVCWIIKGYYAQRNLLAVVNGVIGGGLSYFIIIFLLRGEELFSLLDLFIYKGKKNSL